MQLKQCLAWVNRRLEDERRRDHHHVARGIQTLHRCGISGRGVDPLGQPKGQRRLRGAARCCEAVSLGRHPPRRNAASRGQARTRVLRPAGLHGAINEAQRRSHLSCAAKSWTFQMTASRRRILALVCARDLRKHGRTAAATIVIGCPNRPSRNGEPNRGSSGY